MTDPTELELAVARAMLLRTMTSATADTPKLERMRELLAHPELNDSAAALVQHTVLDARAAIAEVFRWRPIATAPNGELVLLKFQSGETTVGETVDGSWSYGCDLDVDDPMTHWLPLPPPPDEGSE